MKYQLWHRTEYEYEEPVRQCLNEARVSPRASNEQILYSHSVEVDPQPEVMTQRADFFGNPTIHFAIQSPHQKLVVMARSEIEVLRQDLSIGHGPGEPWEQACSRIQAEYTPAALEARPFCLLSPMVNWAPEMESYARVSFWPGRPIIDAARDLMERIYSDFQYEPTATTIDTPLAEVFEKRAGVCQDFAHFGLACIRSLGLAGRYVSGYLETLPPPGKPKLEGADASHAWLSVYVPDFGWLDLDPTNNVIPGEQHIVTAWGRDYSDVTPIKGIIFGGGEKHTATVGVNVARVAE